MPGDEDSPLSFDVCTEEEAQRLEAAEKKAEERARAAEPNVARPHDVSRSGDLTTADLPQARATRAGVRAAHRV